MEVIVNIHADPNDIPLVDTRSTVADVFAKQREAGWARRSDFDRKARIAALNRLREVLQRRETDIIAALYADFRKPESEVRLTEILPVLQEIAHTKRHLKGWMRSRRAAATLGVFGTRARIRPEPKGICLIIAPWNYPLNLAFGPLVSALAAGNSAIIKPSELTPATSTLIADIVAETFSPDLVAVVEGDAAVAQELLALPFDHIFFTGSPQVGKLVMEAAAKSLASVTLELGGKSPTIVGPTANLKKAARNIVWGKFANNGQTCVCANRLYAQAGIYDAFAKKLAARVAAMKVGPGTEAGVAIGPMINQAAIAKIYRHVEDALSKGARIVSEAVELPAGSNYVAPMVLAGATTDMVLANEETFGPIAPLFRFDTDDEAIAIANGTPYGLAAYFFTQSLKRAWRVGEALEFGMVGLNTGAISTEVAPFGGVKQSGLGREGAQVGIEEYLEMKSFHIGGLD